MAVRLPPAWMSAGGATWLARRHPRTDADVELGHRRIYILPTRPGIVYGAGVIVMLIGSINYMLQLGFMLTFLVAAVGVVAMYHTQRNLVGLVVRGHRAEPVFAGEPIAFQLAVRNPGSVSRPAVGLSFVLPQRRGGKRRFLRESHADPLWCDVPAGGTAIASLPLATRRRGRRFCPTVRIATAFPLGLFRSWTYLTPALSVLVYPEPEANPPPLPASSGDATTGATGGAGGDDLAGVRPYRAGDPRKLIAWRLAARSEELSVKIFDRPLGGDLLLDYAALPEHLGVEQKLSRLTRWLIESEAAGLRYGLRLPGREIPIGSGATQRERCLEALALFIG